jgi:hypothetical protein
VAASVEFAAGEEVEQAIISALCALVVKEPEKAKEKESSLTAHEQ